LSVDQLQDKSFLSLAQWLHQAFALNFFNLGLKFALLQNESSIRLAGHSLETVALKHLRTISFDCSTRIFHYRVEHKSWLIEVDQVIGAKVLCDPSVAVEISFQLLLLLTVEPLHHIEEESTHIDLSREFVPARLKLLHIFCKKAHVTGADQENAFFILIIEFKKWHHATVAVGFCVAN